MAVRLTPPTKMAFNISVALALLALILYLVNVLAVAQVPWHIAFWVAAAAWGLMIASVSMTGI